LLVVQFRAEVDGRKFEMHPSTADQVRAPGQTEKPGKPAFVRAIVIAVAVLAGRVSIQLMQIIPPQLLPNRDKASLLAFLGGCREEARRKGHFQLASISLAVRHISPLAVLQSIYEPEELHFYVERGVNDEAVAGAEAVVEARFSGAERFSQAKAFAQNILENSIAVGDLSEPFAGPHFFTAFAFDDVVRDDAAFAAATIFVPRWQVSRSGGRYGAVANIRVDPDCDLDQIVDRVWAAYEKFSAFDYPDSLSEEAGAQPTVGAVERLQRPQAEYESAVQQAIEKITRGDFEKIVLAREVELRAEHPWQPLETLNRLREKFGACFTFSFGGGQASSFIGATPERLLRLQKGQLLTEAIAGSAPRSGSAREDARHARNLLESEKDLHEHACVRDSILRRLARCGVEGKAAAQPGLMPLANVQHLRTEITAEVDASVHLLDIVAELHPTPAVGGTPRDAAVPEITGLENIDRGLYAGAIGWFNHRNEGEMIVGLRSALIQGRSARLFAGAGIVDASEPAREYQETAIKLSALLDVME
jgi:menaquinone-specific isochorismate synthase